MTLRRDPLPHSAAGVLLGFILIGSFGIWEQRALNSLFDLDQLLEPGAFRPTPLLIAVRIVLAFLIGLLAGWLCRRVAGNRRAALVLTAIIVIMIGFHSLFALSVPQTNPVPRVGGESPETLQTQLQIQQPGWLTLLLPLLLAAGILLGSRRKSPA